MTNQITSSSIVFLQNPLSNYSKNLANNMIKIWQEKGEIIQIIESEGAYDDNAVSQLIIEVMASKEQPVTIMIDHDLLYSPIYNLLWSVLGTLSVAGLAKITSYQWHYNEIIFEDFSDPPNQFLSKAAHYFENFSIFNSWMRKVKS